jgi:methylmalonyl-CoA mutase
MSDHPRQEPAPLLAEFPLPDSGAWRAEAERLLKGAPFAKALVTRTLEGVDLAPMATEADTAGLPWLDSLPGQAPFVRGARPAEDGGARWLVAQELPLPAAAEVNEALRHDLERGLEAVHLVLDAAGRRGLDPDAAPAADVGRGGTSLATAADLVQIFAGIEPAAHPLLLQAGASALPVAALLLAALQERGADPAELCGCLGGDPLAQWAADGTLPRPLAALRDEQAALLEWAEASAPGLGTVPVTEDPWHDGGADGALSLGLVLASAVDALRDLEARGIEPGRSAARIRFHVCIASDFFGEIARLRALRLLWTRVQEAAGLEPQPALIQARTSRRTQTVHDPHVNMLRATTQAFSAVLGGAQALHVAPFDEVDSVPDAFGRRIARNVQLLLRHETRADHVSDPAGGSWFAERLTADLAEAAWKHFQDIEAAGGLAAALVDGTVQARITEAADRRRDRLATGRDVLVGTTRYADPAEPVRAPRGPAPGFASTRGREVAGARSTAAVSVPAPGAAPQAALDALVAAAAAGASLGALSAALAAAAPGEAAAIEPVAVRRDAAPFEELRARVAGLAAADPGRARVACACMGSLPRTLPRLDFVRGFLRTAGFTVAEGEFHQAPAAAAAAALADGAATVMVVALDDVYAAEGEALVRALKAGDSPPRVLVAGRPEAQAAALAAAGADDFIHVRSNLLETLGALVAALEVSR